MTTSLLESVKWAREFQHRAFDFNAQLGEEVAQLDIFDHPVNYDELIAKATKYNSTLASRNITSIPVKTNKMVEVWTGAQALTKHVDLTLGSSLPTMGGNDPWGTPQTTFESAKNVATYLHLTSQDIMTAFTPNIPVVHVYSGETAVVQSGYEFGGGRDSYPWSYDCSSLLKKYTPHDGAQEDVWSKAGFSTADLLFAFLELSGKSNEATQTWLTSPDGQALPQVFSLVKEDDLRPGDIWVRRDNITAEKPAGTAGHAGFVIEMPSGNEVQIFSTTRDIAKGIDGIGTDTRTMTPFAANQEIFFLRANHASVLPENWSLQAAVGQADTEVPESFESIFAKAGDHHS